MPYEPAGYPLFAPLSLEARQYLHPRLRALEPVVSEFTFANLYLFRAAHGYSFSTMPDGNIVIAGSDDDGPFFMLPAGLPLEDELAGLARRFSSIKCVDEKQALELASLGYEVAEDRANFDYLYSRAELSSLSGRRFHRKKNLVNYFTGRYSYEARPLTGEHAEGALSVLKEWRARQEGPGDYDAASEALRRMDELALCGAIYFVEGAPAAYTLGEELNSRTFVVHFEKAASGYKGLAQFVNMSFASVLPEGYELINREQDLGQQGLRLSKASYRPVGFVRKYRARQKGVVRERRDGL